MSTDRQARTYCVNGIRLEVACSSAIAACLDSRFRMYPSDASCLETISLDFRATQDARQHSVQRPQGQSRPFYELPNGEASYFSEADQVYVSFRDGVRALCNPRTGEASISVLETDPRNLFMASHLVLTILVVDVFRRRGWYSLHAAGFSEGGAAVLVPGTSGIGKSTLSVALLRAKFGYLTDDMVFLARRSNSLAVRGLAEDIDVSEQTIRFFPELEFLLRSPKTDGFTKRQLRIEEVYGAKPVVEARPSIIVLPRISGKPESVLARMDSDQALLEIVPNVLLTEQTACQQHISVLAELVKQVDCYRLETGHDFDRIPALLRQALAQRQETVCA
jgi:hypothetical protein